MKKHKEGTIIEMRVHVPEQIHRFLLQRQEQHKQRQQPFKSLSDFAVDAMIDGLFRELYIQQMLEQLQKEQLP